MDIAKATVIDISNGLLKIAAPYIYLPLANLFNLSIRPNLFPEELGIAKVSSIFKAGKRIHRKNYRPISVIPTAARLVERLIYEQYSYLDNNNLINTQQSGLRSFHPTVNALLDLTNDWFVNIDNKLVNGAIFLDLKKVFDTADHETLLKKLGFFWL